MKKKVLALFMAVSLASTSLPMTVLATETSNVSQQEELGIAEDSETTEETELTEADNERESEEETESTKAQKTAEATETQKTAEATETIEQLSLIHIFGNDRECAGRLHRNLLCMLKGGWLSGTSGNHRNSLPDSRKKSTGA